MNSHESVQRFSTQIQEDVSRALAIPVANIAVLGYQRGSVVAEVAISQPDHAEPLDALDLAKDLVEQANDPSSRLRSSEVGAILNSVILHGPVCESACTAIRNGVEVLERQKDLLSDGLKEAFEAIAIMKEEKEQVDIEKEKAEYQVHAFLDFLTYTDLKWSTVQ